MERVHKKIDRRMLSLQLLDHAWATPVAVFLQYLTVFFQLLFGSKDDDGGPPR